MISNDQKYYQMPNVKSDFIPSEFPFISVIIQVGNSDFLCHFIKVHFMELVNKYCVKHCLSFNQPLPNTHNHMQYDENFSYFQQIFVNKNILFFVIVIVQKFKSSECFLPFMFCVFVYKTRYVCL